MIKFHSAILSPNIYAPSKPNRKIPVLYGEKRGRESMPKIYTNYKHKSIKKRIKQNQAVSEIVGEIIMLMIVISSFSVFYFRVSSIPPPNNPPNITIVSRIEGNALVLQHKRGDSLNLDTKITINNGHDKGGIFSKRLSR